MIDHDNKSHWKQHFPTYAFKERDIALNEYRTAAKNLESEERVFLNATNIVLIAAAGIGSLTLGYLRSLTKTFSGVIPPELTLIILLFLTGSFSVVTLRYFADRQKSVVFAAERGTGINI